LKRIGWRKSICFTVFGSYRVAVLD
jgi:hypothetical protein